jgi:S1-C subfamily serine protease
MKTKILVWLLFTIVALGVAPVIEAQMVFRHGGEEGEDPGNVVMLRELGILAGAPDEEAKELEVIALLPDADPELDLKRGDLLLMIDGKRVRDSDAAREIYEAAEIGQTIKVGFRRGDERFLRSFEKSDEPPGQMRMMVMGGPGSMGEMHPLTEFGAILGEKEDSVVVSMVLPMDEALFEEDDIVKSINGKSVTSISEFREAYEALAIGEDIALSVERDGETIDSTRAKADAPTRFRVGGGG